MLEFLFYGMEVQDMKPEGKKIATATPLVSRQSTKKILDNIITELYLIISLHNTFFSNICGDCGLLYWYLVTLSKIEKKTLLFILISTLSFFLTGTFFLK